MKKILILSSLFVAVCFVVVNMSVAKRNASVSLQLDNVEALTVVGGPVYLETCYMNVPAISGTGVFIFKCGSATGNNSSGKRILYPCFYGYGAGSLVESSQSSVSIPKECYVSPE
jgi:hypothetical protein